MNSDLIKAVAAKEHELIEADRNYSKSFATKIAGSFDADRMDSYLQLMDEPSENYDLFTEAGRDSALILIEEDIEIAIEEVDGLETVEGFVEELDEEAVLTRAKELGIELTSAPAP